MYLGVSLDITIWDVSGLSQVGIRSRRNDPPRHRNLTLHKHMQVIPSGYISPILQKSLHVSPSPGLDSIRSDAYAQVSSKTNGHSVGRKSESNRKHWMRTRALCGRAVYNHGCISCYNSRSFYVNTKIVKRINQFSTLYIREMLFTSSGYKYANWLILSQTTSKRLNSKA